MKKIPKELEPLAIEVRKYNTAEECVKAFSHDIKHGRYWHVTRDPNFRISPLRGPRDMSSLAAGEEDVGSLMVTSDLEYWVEEYKTGEEECGSPPRRYVAEIDMSAAGPREYWQVSRGFGNEFFIPDSSMVHVMKVLPVEEALKEAKEYHTLLENTIGCREDLIEFWRLATAESSVGGQSVKDAGGK